MVGVVLGAIVAGRAVGGVRVADRQRVALDPCAAVVVQLAIVEVIEVIVVADGGVPAAGAVLVIVCLAGHAVTFLLAAAGGGRVRTPARCTGGQGCGITPTLVTMPHVVTRPPP